MRMPCVHCQGIRGRTGYKGTGQLYAKRLLGEVCGEWGQNQKREGKNRPSGISRAAFLHELYMDVGTISGADKRGMVRKSQTI